MKTFKTILAVAVAAMAFVGCAKEQNVELNEKVTMTYSVSLDSASGTRAFDGLNVTHLDYKMYLLNANDSTTPTAAGTVEKDGTSFPVTLEFLKGQQYKVTFIAYNSANFGTDKWCKYTDSSKQRVVFDYTKDAEDLFTGVFTLSASDTSTSLSLARPLAQVNLYLSENDVTKATALGFKADEGVTFSLKSMANQYDLLTETASGSAGVKSYSGTVAGAANGYHHLGSALVLGGEQGHNVEGEIYSIGNVEYGTDGHAVPGIPTAANKKTNVRFSSLLVGSVAYSVTLTTGFAGTEDKVIP